MSASYLFVVQGPGLAPQVRELSAPRVVIGRETGDVVVPDARCSSTHAEITFDGRNVRVRDLGSTNGTLVNGVRTDDVAWTPGVVLQIGAHTLTMKEVRAAAPAKGRTVAGNVMLGGPGVAPPAGSPPAGSPPPGSPPPGAGASSPGYGAPAAGYGAGAYGHAPPAMHGHHGPAHGAAHGHPGMMMPGPHAHGAHHAPHGMAPGYPPPRKGMAAWMIAVPLALLGACGIIGGVALVGATKAATGTASAPVLTEPRDANVKFVWFSGSPGATAKGGTSPARVRVGPNKGNTVSVGVSEEFAGGGGNQWRTATWLAAFNATRTTGASLSDYEFNVHVGGHVDGPSAGMLTTATMLALLRGHEPRTDTTMTGTINPDGTAGPVGGIVQKMQGAKADGLKRFGFPIGARQHKDMQTGQMVDLVAVGQSLGLEVKEIDDIYAGYEFLTGDTLPRVEPLAESELEPTPESQALLRAKVATWKARVERELGTLKAESARTGTAVQAAAPLLQDADKAFVQAQQFERNGFMVPALESYANTAIQIATATRLTQAVFHIQRNDLKALFAAVDTASKVKPEVESYGSQLEVKAHGKTRGGQISTTYAYGHYVTARAATMIGDDFLDGAVQIIKALESGRVKPSQQAVQQLMLKTTAPTLYYDIARVYLDYAKDVQDLIVDEGAVAPLDGPTIDRTVKGYASASGAVLAYFDALITEEVARENNVSADEARDLIANKEAEYYLARKANMLSEYTGSAATTDGAKLMRLGAASQAYLSGAKLVNKWYSLSASFDKEGKLVLENRRALTAQLDLARRSARESAARAKATAGFVPSPARLSFQTANALREGSDDDKLSALASYWQATFWSELAATGAKR